MYGVSQQFLDTLRIGHTAAFAALCYPPGSSSSTPLALLDGQLTIDRTAMTRRTGTITVLASDVGSTLDVRALPQGGYVELRRGIAFADLTKELVPIGYMRIESVSVDAVDGTAQLELADRMAQVNDMEFTRAFDASGMLPTAAMQAMVTAVFPGITVNIDVPAEQSTLTDTHYDSGRAQAILDLATAIGFEAYFSFDGSFRARQIPTVTNAPVWTIDAGNVGVLVELADATDRTESFNAFLVRGRAGAASKPFSALATAISGPLTYGGAYGKVIKVVDSTAVRTKTQATSTAKALLAGQLGLGRTLTLAAIPNPALQVGDTVKIVFPDGHYELHLIDTLAIPLTPADSMKLTTRSLYTGTSGAAATLADSIATYTDEDVAVQLRGADVLEDAA